MVGGRTLSVCAGTSWKRRPQLHRVKQKQWLLLLLRGLSQKDGMVLRFCMLSQLVPLQMIHLHVLKGLYEIWASQLFLNMEISLICLAIYPTVSLQPRNP